MTDEDYDGLTTGQRSVIDHLIALGDPVTRENYIAMAYNDDLPEPWTAEHEAELPEFLQRR